MKIGIQDVKHLGDSICVSSVFEYLSKVLPEHTIGIYVLSKHHKDVYTNSGVPVFRDCDIGIPMKYTGDKVNLCETFLRHAIKVLNKELGTNIELPTDRYKPAIKISEDELSRYDYLGDYILIAPASMHRGPHKNYPHLQHIIDSRPDKSFVAVSHSYDGIEKLTGCANFIGDTSVRQVLALVAKAQHVISYSGALVHAAYTFDVPCSVILGCSDRWWYTDYPNVTHYLSECNEGYSWDNPCSKKLCPVAYEHHGIKYPRCISTIDPYFIAESI